MCVNRLGKSARWGKRQKSRRWFGEVEKGVRWCDHLHVVLPRSHLKVSMFLLLIQIWRPDFCSPTGLCPGLSYPMILLQHAGLPLPKRPSSSPPMSVAARSTGTLQHLPQKPFGQEASLPLAGEEEFSKGGEQDSALEELCKPLYCKLCNVTLNSAQQAQAHYQVREEKKSRHLVGEHFRVVSLDMTDCAWSNQDGLVNN